MNDSLDPTLFTGILSEIYEVAGKNAVIAIVEEKGGQRVDIPAQITNNHWLAKCVGFKTAKIIAENLSIRSPEGRLRGVRHEIIPLGFSSHRKFVRKKLYSALISGKSVREAAAIAGVHERTAFRAKKS